MGIEMEDIVLVTGCHRTRSWSNIAFNEVQADARVSLGVEVGGVLGASVNWRVSRFRVQGAVHGHRTNGEVFVRQITSARILISTYSFRTYPRINAYLSEDSVSNVFSV